MILSEVLAAQSLPCVLSCPYKNTRFQKNLQDLHVAGFTLARRWTARAWAPLAGWVCGVMMRSRAATRAPGLTTRFAARCFDRAAVPTSRRWLTAAQDRAPVATPGGASHGSRGSAAAPTVSLWQGEAEWQLRGEEAPVLRVPAQSTVHRVGLSVRQMILPRGFPRSVSPGYEGYTGWLAVGLFAHSFTVMVSTNALLSGFFAEMSAASWLMKDLLPPLLAGTLATRIRTLEANPKKWLGAACFANSLLGVAEFLIPHLLPLVRSLVITPRTCSASPSSSHLTCCLRSAN